MNKLEKLLNDTVLGINLAEDHGNTAWARTTKSHVVKKVVRELEEEEVYDPRAIALKYANYMRTMSNAFDMERSAISGISDITGSEDIGDYEKVRSKINKRESDMLNKVYTHLRRKRVSEKSIHAIFTHAGYGNCYYSVAENYQRATLLKAQSKNEKKLADALQDLQEYRAAAKCARDKAYHVGYRNGMRCQTLKAVAVNDKPENDEGDQW